MEAQPGPYRRSAREPGDAPVRGVTRAVSIAGAVLIVAGALVVGYSAYDALAHDGALDDARDEFRGLLRDPRVRGVAMRFAPEPAVELPELATGEVSEDGFRMRVRQDGSLPDDARGIVVQVPRVRIDEAQPALSARAATAAYEVTFVALVRRRMLRERYAYGGHPVDVEAATVAVVDLERERVVAQIALEASPPPHVQSAQPEYRLLPRHVAQAIERALRE